MDNKGNLERSKPRLGVVGAVLHVERARGVVEGREIPRSPHSVDDVVPSTMERVPQLHPVEPQAAFAEAGERDVFAVLVQAPARGDWRSSSEESVVHRFPSPLVEIRRHDISWSICKAHNQSMLQSQPDWITRQLGLRCGASALQIRHQAETGVFDQAGLYVH
jgi:hypothetical protein